jgi:uncharacterized protein
MGVPINIIKMRWVSCHQTTIKRQEVTLPMTKFSINAAPSTDVWRKPPSTFSFNAPTAKTVKGPLKSFKRARLTVILPHSSELVKYDQGGILVSVVYPGQEPENAQWLKSGIEYYLDQPWLGTVGCDRWADWSISPIVRTKPTLTPTATIELERTVEDGQTSLWLYSIVPGSNRIPLREATWFFAEEDSDDYEISLSAYAARPTKKEGNEEEELQVDFENFEVEWLE